MCMMLKIEIHVLFSLSKKFLEMNSENVQR